MRACFLVSHGVSALGSALFVLSSSPWCHPLPIQTQTQNSNQQPRRVATQLHDAPCQSSLYPSLPPLHFFHLATCSPLLSIALSILSLTVVGTPLCVLSVPHLCSSFCLCSTVCELLKIAAVAVLIDTRIETFTLRLSWIRPAARRRPRHLHNLRLPLVCSFLEVRSTGIA